jgi:hypothetical protein
MTHISDEDDIFLIEEDARVYKILFNHDNQILSHIAFSRYFHKKWRDCNKIPIQNGISKGSPEYRDLVKMLSIGYQNRNSQDVIDIKNLAKNDLKKHDEEIGKTVIFWMAVLTGMLGSLAYSLLQGIIWLTIVYTLPDSNISKSFRVLMGQDIYPKCAQETKEDLQKRIEQMKTDLTPSLSQPHCLK